MRDENEKRQQRARFERQMKHHVDHGELKRRKAEARHRAHGDRGKPGRNQSNWTKADDEFDDSQHAGFEKIRKRRDAQQGRSAGFQAEAGDLPAATVTAIHHGRVQIWTEPEDDRVEEPRSLDARIAHRLALDPELRIAVGDRVLYSETDGPCRVEAILERKSSLSRPDPGNPNRELVLAANVDVGVVVVAARNPELRPGLIDRFLLALAHGDVHGLVCVNKIDLLGDAERDQLTEVLAPYRELEVPVQPCSANTAEGIDELRSRLAGKTCVLVGHSGVGKSSILNAVDPDGQRSIGDVRDRDGKGRHTTTWSSMRELRDGTRVIDTPGIRAFGLDGWSPEQVRAGFAEFAPIAGGCRFSDCSHVDEPDCAVRQAVQDGDLAAARYGSYLRILQSLAD